MAASSSVQSSAFNFMSCLKTGVDPRTGLYRVSIDLPEVASNSLHGPGFALGMSYSALNTGDSGYGLGWNLQLSQYTPGNQILSLATGETFKVTDSSANGELLMRDKKLDTFHFYRVDATHFRVVHKSGLVELLELVAGQNRIALPTEIYAASGHKVTLEYRSFGGGNMILEAIKDGSGEVLLSIARPVGATEIEYLLHPFAGPEGGPLARFVMTLQSTTNHVTRITLPTENRASWRFVYQVIQEHLCITAVDTPVGGHEDIYYQDQGHQFPVGSGRNPLPRVTRHVLSPGFGQPPVDVRYTYPQNRNFLGFGLSIPWSEDGYDNLFKYLGEYEYHCEETLWVDNLAVRSIARSFNHFHLLNREVTTQNNNRHTVETTYAYALGIPYSEQPNTCQLPSKVTTSWSLLDDPTRYRSESVSSRYDPYGNLIEQTNADGTVEKHTWYAAAGEDGCPPDPEGFVRNLKEQIVTPAAAAQGNAPTLITRFRYRALAALPDSGLGDWLVPERQTLLHLDTTERELQQTQIEYHDVPSDEFLHGRIARRTTTLNGLSTITSLEYSLTESVPDAVPTLQTTTTLSTDFDSATSATVQQQSLLGGQALMMESDGLQTRFAYDALGRLVTQTVAPDTPFEASRQYEYFLCSTTGEQAQQIQISAQKVITRTLVDGLGRLVREERDHVDPKFPDRLKRTYEARYNTWGVLEDETACDWLDEGVRELAVTTRMEYDDWGLQSCTIGPDGVQMHTCTDPIGNSASKGPIVRSWRQSADDPPKLSGLTDSWLNLFGKPSQTRTLDAEEQEIGVQTWLYDGLGRCVEHTDELHHVTTFEYDAWSRLTLSRLPDQSVVKREYAEHTTTEQTVALHASLDGTTFSLAGRQEFDGLLRLKQLEVGSRIERFEYQAGHSQVKTRITPAGVPIEYQYNRVLTDQPTTATAPDETARFDYDSSSAKLIMAANERGTRVYDYDMSNRLTAERWVSAGKTWETLYSTTLQGRLTQRTEQKQAGSPGLDTHYQYDAIGRLQRIEQGRLRATFEYDSLGEAWRTTTEDLDAGTSLVTELEYDDQGRETLRTLKADQHPARTIEQQWQADGNLESRELREGSVSLLAESFSYDARGRLNNHVCTGTTLPRDGLGREITEQIYTFDTLDNISLSVTTFADGQWERARFLYDGADPFQLTGISYTPARATPNPVFTYDLNGNQLQDELGRALSYDSQSRLLMVQSPGGQPVSEYRYDGHDHLVTSLDSTAAETLRFYQEHLLTSSVRNGASTQYLHHEDRPLGEQQTADPSKTLLLLTDPNASVIGETAEGELRSAVYTAYGERHAEPGLQTQLAFNGELRDTDCGWYLLGSGYRAYNPGLMRFHSPDSLSPFGPGGLNPYTYCLGNPIALRDPTGNAAIGYSGRPRRPDEGAVEGLARGGGNIMAWVGVAVAAVFTAIGVASLAMTAGIAAPVAVPMIGLGPAVGAPATAGLVASTVLSGAATAASTVAAVSGDEDAGQAAFWLSMAALGAGFAAGILNAGAKAAPKLSPRPSVGSAANASPPTNVLNALAEEVPVSQVVLRDVATQVPPPVPLKPAPKVPGAPPPVPSAPPPLKIPQARTTRPAITLDDLNKANLKPRAASAPKSKGMLDQLAVAVKLKAEGASTVEAALLAHETTEVSRMLANASAQHAKLVRQGAL